MRLVVWQIGQTSKGRITATIGAVMMHRTWPRWKPSGAGGHPVEDWGAGAMLMPRGLWDKLCHRWSLSHKRGSAHSLCRVLLAIASVLGNLFGAALGLGVECGVRYAVATGVWLGAMMVFVGLVVLFYLTGSDSDD